MLYFAVDYKKPGRDCVRKRRVRNAMGRSEKNEEKRLCSIQHKLWHHKSRGIKCFMFSLDYRD